MKTRHINSGTTVWLILTIALLVSTVRCGDPGVSDGTDLLLPSLSAPRWVQTEWSGGVGSNTEDQYSAATGLEAATAGQFSLTPTGDWFDMDWKHRRAITITNSGEAQTDYPVRLGPTTVAWSTPISLGVRS